MSKKNAEKDNDEDTVDAELVTEADLVSVAPKPRLFMSSEESLESWCRKIVGLTDPKGDMPCKVRLDVRQTRHEKYNKLLEIPIAGDAPGEVARQVQTEAERTGYRDVRVAAFYPGSRLPCSQYVIPGDEFGIDDDDDSDDTGGGLSAAVVRQAVRHTETMVQSMMAMQVGVMRHLSDQNRALTANAERLATERLDLIELVRKVKLESLDETDRAQRTTAIAGAVQTLVDAAAFRLTDGNSNNAREELMAKMLQGFGKSISEEQEAALREVFTAEQLITLAELIKDPKAHTEAVQQAIQQKSETEGEGGA